MASKTIISDFKLQTSASKTIAAFIRLAIGVDDRSTLLDTLNSTKINLPIFFNHLRNHKCQEIVLHTIKVNQLSKFLPNFTQRLETVVDKKHKHSAELWQECVTYCNELDKQSIPYVIYKGKAFAKQFYPSIRLRHSVDVDIGMTLDNIPKAAAILKSQGYEEHKGSIDYANISQSRAYHIDFSYVKRDDEGNILYNIELHWTIAHHVLNIDYGIDQLILKREELLINKNLMSTLPKIEQAIIMIIHHGMVDVWGKLRHLIDLHYVLETLNEDEKSIFIKKLKQQRLFNCYTYGVELLEILKNNAAPTELWALILSGNMSKNWSEYRLKLWWHLKMRESNIMRIQVLFSILKFRLKFGKTNQTS